MTDIDANVLSQIILLQSTVHAMQEPQALAPFVLRGISRIPGIRRVGMFVQGHSYSDGDHVLVVPELSCQLFEFLTDEKNSFKEKQTFLSHFKQARQLECLQLETVFTLYGFLFLSVTDKNEFAGIKPYLENTMNIVALVIENDNRKQLLLESKENLEKLVSHKTRALKATIDQLQTEMFWRKKNELKLRQSDDIVNNIQVGLHIYKLEEITDDRTLTLIDTNRASETMLGLAGKDLVGKTIDRIFPAFRKLGVPAIFADVVRSGTPRYLDSVQYVFDDGHEACLKINVFPLPNHCVGAAMENITEQVRAEAALKASELRYKTLFENAIDAIFIIAAEGDDIGRVVDANIAAARMHGYSQEELRRLNIRDLVASQDGDHFIGRLDKNLAWQWTKEEVYHVKKNGDVFPMEISAGVIEINDQKCILAIDRDITERKQNEIERANLFEQLRQSQKMEAIGTLAGGIAHDFNNLLAIILGNAELALDETDEEMGAYSYLMELKTASLRSKELIRQILDFSRRSTPEKELISIGPVLNESIRLIRASLPASVNIRLMVPDVPIMVNANMTQLYQVFMNLCNNAAQAMNFQGDLTISLEDVVLPLGKGEPVIDDLVPGTYVRIGVRDTGAGIRDEHLERIFDPYFTTKPVGQGSGLGLSVVFGIVKSHDGTISVWSEAGRGTEFHVYLPVSHGAAPSHEVDEPVVRQGDERILIVDDDPMVLRMTSRILSNLGYGVVSETDSRRALEMFFASPEDFDLIITDMTMPEMSGEKFAEEVLQRRRRMPVILCTGHSDAMDDEKAAHMGIRKYLMKPLTRAGLADAVRQVLDGSLTVETE